VVVEKNVWITERFLTTTISPLLSTAAIQVYYALIGYRHTQEKLEEMDQDGKAISQIWIRFEIPAIKRVAFHVYILLTNVFNKREAGFSS